LCGVPSTSNITGQKQSYYRLFKETKCGIKMEYGK
jgi:hypothetical protein